MYMKTLSHILKTKLTAPAYTSMSATDQTMQPKTLLLAVTGTSIGKDFSPMMIQLVCRPTERGYHADGLCLDDNEASDVKAKALLDSETWDVISVGGGVRSVPSWHARVAGLIKESRSAGAAISEPNGPGEVDKVVQVVAELQGQKKKKEDLQDGENKTIIHDQRRSICRRISISLPRINIFVMLMSNKCTCLLHHSLIPSVQQTLHHQTREPHPSFHCTSEPHHEATTLRAD